jgi:ABC-type branched-subunit amino acid transport system substrate-binding protein
MYMPITGNPTGVTYPVARVAAEATVKYLTKSTGRKWQLVFCDPKEDPNVAAQCGRTFAEEGVVAVVGGLSTQGDKINDVLETEGIASVGNFPINASDFFSPISFPLDGGSAMAYPGAVFQLAKQGAKRVFVARLDVGAASVIVNFIRAAAESAGLEFAGSVAIPSAAPDMAPYVSAAQDADADAMIPVLALSDMTKLLRAAKQIGADFQYGSGPGDPQGGLFEGIARSSPTPPPSDLVKMPEGKEYLKAMKRYAKGLEGQAVKQVIDFLGPDAEISAASVLEGFRTIPELDLGVTPPFKPDGPGPVKVFPRLTNTYEYLTTTKKNIQVLTQKNPIDVAAKVDFDAALSGG